MPLGINPLIDFAFMMVFATPEGGQSLIDFLNAVLRPKSPITDVTVQNPFNYKDFQDDKLCILDVKAVDAGRAWYDVEVQLDRFRPRSRQSGWSILRFANWSWTNSGEGD